LSNHSESCDNDTESHGNKSHELHDRNESQDEDQLGSVDQSRDCCQSNDKNKSASENKISLVSSQQQSHVDLINENIGRDGNCQNTQIHNENDKGDDFILDSKLNDNEANVCVSDNKLNNNDAEVIVPESEDRHSSTSTSRKSESCSSVKVEPQPSLADGNEPIVDLTEKIISSDTAKEITSSSGTLQENLSNSNSAVNDPVDDKSTKERCTSEESQSKSEISPRSERNNLTGNSKSRDSNDFSNSSDTSNMSTNTSRAKQIQIIIRNTNNENIDDKTHDVKYAKTAIYQITDVVQNTVYICVRKLRFPCVTCSIFPYFVK